jgi:hypothetical protein
MVEGGMVVNQERFLPIRQAGVDCAAGPRKMCYEIAVMSLQPPQNDENRGAR